ncbi:MFS transporter [Acidaminobacterium chupaoyuni]
MQQKARGRIFYGWYIVAASFLIMAVSVGIVNNCAGVYVKPVCAELGFSRKGMAVNSTIFSACGMIVALSAGRIYSRFDVTKVMRFSGITMSLGYFCFSFCRTLPMFYGAAFVTGFSEALLVSISLSMLLNNWFHKKRGTAIGIAFMGSGVGGMICNTAAGILIQQTGWQNTYRVLAAAMFVIVVPCCFFIIRTRPADMGLLAYGEDEQPESGVSAAPLHGEGMTLAEVQRTPKFWMLCFCSIFVSICTAGLMHNVAPHISDVGYSPTFAAAIASACMGALAIGKMLLGWLYDHLGPRRATFLSCAASVIGLCGALIVPIKAGLGMMMLGTGLGGAFGSVATPIIARTLYGDKEFGAVLGRMSAFGNGGAMFAPILVGSAYDSFGTYKPAFAGMLVAMIAVTLIYQRVFGMRRERSTV